MLFIIIATLLFLFFATIVDVDDRVGFMLKWGYTLLALWGLIIIARRLVF